MTTTFHDTVNMTSKSNWSRPKKFAWYIKSKFLRWCLCINDDLLDVIQDEALLRDEIRGEMVQHNGGYGTASVTKCMKEIFNETSYDMSNYTAAVDELVSTDADPHEIEAQLNALGLTATPATIVATKNAMVIPKFAAALVLCLRSKFGNLSLTEANRLLIEREYLRICQTATVRNVDIVMHQQCVINAYFTEGVMEEVCTVRTRVPRWLREAFGSVPRVEPTVC